MGFTVLHPFLEPIPHHHIQAYIRAPWAYFKTSNGWRVSEQSVLRVVADGPGEINQRKPNGQDWSPPKQPTTNAAATNIWGGGGEGGGGRGNDRHAGGQLIMELSKVSESFHQPGLFPA